LGLDVIPKAVSFEHLKDNFSVLTGFELEQVDVEDINCLNENEHLCWNPDTVL
jgi:diketogulonate reductase-like aldo/keto reductase